MLEVVGLAAELAGADESVLQLHLGPLRDVSPWLLARVGRDAGGDVIGDERQAPGLARFLGGLERDERLPRTILYNVNPADNALFAAIAGAFSRPGVAPSCSGDRHGGSTTTSRACDGSSTTCRRSVSWRDSSACRPTRARSSR